MAIDWVGQAMSMAWTVGIVIALITIALASAGLFYWVWIKVKYPIQGSYRKVFGDVAWETTSRFTLGRRKSCKIGWNATKTGMKVLWQKAELPPFPIESIVSGNQIDLYMLPNGKYVPASHDLLKQGEQITAMMTCVKPEFKRWGEIELKEYAEKYNNKTVWDKLNPFLTLGGVIVGCVLLLSITVFAAYHMFSYGADRGFENVQMASKACSDSCVNSVIGICGGENLTRMLAPQVVTPSGILPGIFGGGTPT